MAYRHAWFAVIGGILVAGWVRAGTLQAQPQTPATPIVASSSSCGTGNLLAGRRPWQSQDLRGNPALLTDGSLGPEGAQWDAPVAVVLETGAASITYDLGQPTWIAALVIQADANDVYQLQGSLDGTPGSYQQLVVVDNVVDRGHGLRTRSLLITPVQVRFVRVGEAVGDGLYSVSEVAAYCQAPAPFPPPMRRVDAPPATVVKRPWYRFDWWQNNASARLEMVLALLALLLLGWRRHAEKTGQDSALNARAPALICAFSLSVHVAIACILLIATSWVPAWMAIVTFYLSVEFALLAAPLSSRFPTPLRFLVRRLQGRNVSGGTPRGCRARATGRARARGNPAPRVGEPPSPPSPAVSVRRQLLVLVGILSFLAYWNFGAFHFGNYVHQHEVFHYYVGAKYFDELSYLRLYDCASVAEAQDPTLRRRVELRKITNLRTNILGIPSEILAHPEQCTRHFTPARWAAFKQDVAYFRTRLGVKRWEEALGDHGYNATPVWTIAGRALANLSPASDQQVWFLTRIDPVLIIGMVLMIGWAFGWQALCVALAVFATNFPSRFNWNGGAYLRWDFLFHMTAGVCLIKKGKPLLGGYLVAAAALLRVFPGFLLLGPIFLVIQQLARRLSQQLRDQTKGPRWWLRLSARQLRALLGGVDRAALRVLLGAALAVATLVPLSLPAVGGVDGYRAFLQNSVKHTSTPLTNYMGWRTVVAYQEQTAGRNLRSARLEDPWKDWKDARLRTFHRRQWLYVAGVLAFAALLYRAVRGVPPWEATALASSMIAVVPELTGYFYSFVIVLALLWTTRKNVVLALLAVTTATGFIDWAPTQFLPRRFPWDHLQMPTWLDEQYTLMSVVTLLGIAFVLSEYAFVRGEKPPVG